jgi:hypothetical protein
MKWREVIGAENVGTGAAFEDGACRIIWLCHLECGHCSMITSRNEPRRLDCMLCHAEPVQLMLPMVMPVGVKSGVGTAK